MQNLGNHPFKLGFGLMRLPRLSDDTIDVPQVCQMVDAFLEAGGTYFDTAFVYPGSEEAIRKALVERHPRESYTLATKLMANGENLNEETLKQEFETSLERTGAGYFDFYLLHALQRSNYQHYDTFHLWDFVRDLKAKGLIKHYGFSFHGDPELLEMILQEHPDAEFVQLQINYADWDNPGVAGRKNWEICLAHQKPVIIMEPVKGGILADPIDSVKKILSKANPSASYASWALRYAMSKDNVFAVLSGMSSLAQMKDNLSQVKDFKPLSQEEMRVIIEAQHALDEDKAIPCTACHYCTAGCPMNIPIPEIFTVFNRRKGSPEFRVGREYRIVTQNKGRASECIECGQCEGACPQQLTIIDLLKECVFMEGL